jgi:aspartyl aminopeptidase
MRQVSMPTVDIGLAQLAMHSAYETTGVRDIEFMVRACRQFYKSAVTLTEDGTTIVRS